MLKSDIQLSLNWCMTICQIYFFYQFFALDIEVKLPAIYVYRSDIDVKPSGLSENDVNQS